MHCKCGYKTGMKFRVPEDGPFVMGEQQSQIFLCEEKHLDAEYNEAQMKLISAHRERAKLYAKEAEKANGKAPEPQPVKDLPKEDEDEITE